MSNSVKLVVSICFSLMVGNSFTAPVLVKPDLSDRKPLLVQSETGNTKATLGEHIGSAVAPVVGAVVGPLLVNIANGITNGITSTITSGYEPLDFGHNPHPVGPFDVYLVNFDDESHPYLLLESIGNGHEKPQYYGAASFYNTLDQKSTLDNNSHDTRTSLPEVVNAE